MMSSKIPTMQRVQKCDLFLLLAKGICYGYRKQVLSEGFLKNGEKQVILSLAVNSFLPKTKDIFNTLPTT